MSKPSTYLVVTYFLTYLPIYETLFCIELVTKVKPNINSVEVYPQPSNNMRLVDGAMVVHFGPSYFQDSLVCTYHIVCNLKNLQSNGGFHVSMSF
jgi:hypothetical protein